MSDKPQTQERTSVRKSFGRRSSFFSGRRLSFFRSKGTRGADVETLRGNTGAAFEGKARVARCGDYMNCCGLKLGTVEESTSKKPRFLLVKGSSLFVFTTEDAPSPKYAIPLLHLHAEAEDESHGHIDVLLKTGLGDVEYRFIFDTSKDKEIVPKFMAAIQSASSSAQVEATKQRLGHGDQIIKRTSCHYADQIAKEKAKEQPDTPINVTEAMSAVPNTYPI